MNDNKRTFLLSAGLNLAAIGGLVLCFFFPFLLIYFVPLVTVCTAYAGTRLRLPIGFVLPAAAYILLSVFSKDPEWYLLCPLFVIGTAALTAASKFENTHIFAAVTTVCAAVAFAATVAIMCLTAGGHPADAAAYYVENSASLHTESAARAAVIADRESKLDSNLSETEQVAEKLKIREEVRILPSGEVLKEYAEIVRAYMQRNMLTDICTLIPALAAITSASSIPLFNLFGGRKKSRLVRASGRAIGRLSDFRLPKGYVPGVTIPLMILFLIGLKNDVAASVYAPLFPMLFAVPLAVCGGTVTLFFCTRRLKRTGGFLAFALIIPIAVFFYPLLTILGLVDSILNLRRLLGWLDET